MIEYVCTFHNEAHIHTSMRFSLVFHLNETNLSLQYFLSPYLINNADISSYLTKNEICTKIFLKDTCLRISGNPTHYIHASKTCKKENIITHQNADSVLCQKWG
ncbi:hypothetical protein ACJX0J_032432, partial [Zea mays]